jgi:outer membrane protein assembly factor BamA
MTRGAQSRGAVPKHPGSGRGSLLGPFAVVVVLSAASTGAAPVAAQQQAPEVKSVEFVGNQAFPSDSLARAIATRETACRSWVFYFPIPLCPLGVGFSLSRSQLRVRDLPRDRARLVLWYRQRGFRNVQVDSALVERTETTANVTFHIVEGPPVLADSIVFRGSEGLDVAGLLEELPIREGDRLSTIALDATRDTITRRLADQGYAYAEVLRNALRPASDPLRAIVTFDILPGPPTVYGDITVEGTSHLGVGTVLRTAQLTTGEPYSRSQVDEARSRLYGLDIVRSASVVPDTAGFSRDPQVGVAIRVQEGDPYRVRAGGGWSNAECLTAEARWTARNFLGGGRLLQLRGRLGNILAPDFRDVLCRQSGEGEFAELTGLASVDFVQPWIFSTRNALSVSVFYEKQSLPDIFVRRAAGVQVGLSRTIAQQTLLTAFYRPELSRLDADDVLFCTGFLVCSPEDIEELEGANWLSPVGLNLTQDRSDDLLNPRRGHRLLIDLEHAAPYTGSDFRYDRVVGEGSSYTPVGSAVFAVRARGGWVGARGFAGIVGTSGGEEGEAPDIIHPQKRFYSGGANSVRGFAQSRLGPRVLFSEPERLLSGTETGGGCSEAELAALVCVPATEAALDPQPTGGTRLIEANAEMRFPIASLFEGVVFVDAGQAWGAEQSITLASMQFTPGVGVRVPSPVGPIRLDVAYRFRGGENLPVVTEQIRPFAPGDDPDDRLIVDDERIPWVSTGDLVFLHDPFLFGVNDQGLQFHISIGQAF